MKTSVGDVKEMEPYSYQTGDQGREDVVCHYVVSKDHVVRFDLEHYNNNRVLIIDPTLVFSTFSGSRASNWGFTATPGPDGTFFAGGIVWGDGFPVSTGSFENNFRGGRYDIGIIRLSSNGRNRMYATYIGGSSVECPHSMISDAQGNLVVMGRTYSTDFPFQSFFGTPGGCEMFVIKLNATGNNIIGSARIGGSKYDCVNVQDQLNGEGPEQAESLIKNYGDDSRSEVILDASNNIYIAASTRSDKDFPITPGVFQPSFGGGNQDGVIVFGERPAGPLWRVPQAGGVPAVVTAVDTARGETFHAIPVFMPDGKHFIYFRQGKPEVYGIYAGSLAAKPSGQPAERILAGPFAASYANGYLFFMRDGTLMAQPFDTSRLQLRGDPVPVAESLATIGVTGVFSVSSGGTLAYLAGRKSAGFQLTWFDRQGKVLTTFGQPGTDQMIALSPDGTQGVVRDASTNLPAGDLWTLDFARGVRTRFTFRKSVGSWPIWSPEGNRIAFAAGNNLDTLYEKPAAGGSDEKELLKEPGKQILPSGWSRDGRFLLYFYSGGKNGNNIWVLPLEGNRKPAPLLATEFSEAEAVFSPDMQWIAYTSNESGRYEVYVRPFVVAGGSGAPSLGEGKWQISKDGGFLPKWIADGRQIVFETVGNGALMAVDVKAKGARFEAGVPERLFQPPQLLGDYMWDVTADGKRFLLAAQQGAQTGAVPFNIVLNWPALLKKN